MHSIATILSLYLSIFIFYLYLHLLLYRQSNLMLPFSAFDPATITAEKDAVSRCHDFGSSVPFSLLQSNNVTTLCSTGSQQGVDVANTGNAVDRCCANVDRAERDLYCTVRLLFNSCSSLEYILDCLSQRRFYQTLRVYR